MSRGRGEPLANLGPNSFACLSVRDNIIFWPAGIRYQQVLAGTSWYKWYHGTVGTMVLAGTVGTTVLYSLGLPVFYPGIFQRY